MREEVAGKAKLCIDWGMSLYEKVQRQAFRLPFVRIDRRAYLTKALTPYCSPQELERALQGNPLSELDHRLVRGLARQAAIKHALFTAALSFVLAVPCNFYLEMALLAIDVVQFQLVVFIITQKLMYLYGADHDHYTRHQHYSAGAVMLMVSAIMIGSHRVTHTLKTVTGSAARKIVLQAATSAGNRLLATNFIRQACKWLGIEVAKGTVALSFTVLVSLLCCLISALITFWLIYPMCKRLMRHYEGSGIECKA